MIYTIIKKKKTFNLYSWTGISCEGVFLHVLGERYTGSVEVMGSIPTVSTKKTCILASLFYLSGNG